VGLLRPQTQPCPAAATRQQTESAAAVMSPTQSHSATTTRAPLQQLPLSPLADNCCVGQSVQSLKRKR